MSRAAAQRGQPVVMLLLLLAGWCALRLVLWQAPFGVPLAAAAGTVSRAIAPMVRRAPPVSGAKSQDAVRPAPPAKAPREPLWLVPAGAASAPPDAQAPSPGWALTAGRPAPFEAVPPRVAGGQVLLLAAALSHFEVAPELAALFIRGGAAPAAIPAFPLLAGDTSRASAGRWSGDAWLLLRRDTTTPVTSGRGSYGRSQAGAVLRYRLAPESGHRPAAYLRVASALGGEREAEVALGLTARPVPRVPVALAAEVRGARLSEGSEVRPAAFAYTEFPPLKLPLGLRGEAYLQGGYVGGRFATGFVDGQARLDRTVARLGPAELRAGGGAWGGAQRGVRRIDVGPAATVAVEIARAPVRMSADWRFRVAGDANPGSGPALTVSAGF